MKIQLMKKRVTSAFLVLFMIIAVTPSIGFSSYLDDTTPPVTTISFNPPEPDGENGWYVSIVTVTLNATDDDSGVNLTRYKIDSGPYSIYIEPFIISTDGFHKIWYYSIDNAGNQEDEKSAEFYVDQTDPEIWLSYEVVGGDKFKGYTVVWTATANDDTSGMNKVEFYFNGELRETVYGVGPIYQWTCYNFPIVGLKVRGIINNLEITEEYVEFFAVLVIILGIQNWYYTICANAYDNAGNIGEDCIHPPCSIITISPGIYLFKNVTLPNNYEGYIGKFFIKATFDA